MDFILNIETSPEIESSWAAYFKDRSIENRNKLVVMYSEIAKISFLKLQKEYKSVYSIDVHDLKSWTSEALMICVEKFDNSRQTKTRTIHKNFVRFAMIKIRKLVLDQLRENSWTPRLTMTRRKKYTKELAKCINEEEMETLRDKLNKLRTPVFQSPEIKNADSTKNISLLDSEISREPSPESLFDGQELKEIVEKVLPFAERTIVTLYFWGGMSLKDAGKTINLTESRASQVLASACKTLRECHLVNDYSNMEESEV